MSEPDIIEQLLAVCTAVRGDIQLLIDQAVQESGGGVVGEVIARSQFPAFWERREALDAVIERAARRVGTAPP